MDGVEVEGVKDWESTEFKASGKTLGVLVDTERDLVKAFGAVMNRVHRGEGGQEGLCGADIAGGSVSPNVLFACLKGEAVGSAALRIFGYADKTTG